MGELSRTVMYAGGQLNLKVNQIPVEVAKSSTFDWSVFTLDVSKMDTSKIYLLCIKYKNGNFNYGTANGELYCFVMTDGTKCFPVVSSATAYGIKTDGTVAFAANSTLIRASDYSGHVGIMFRGTEYSSGEASSYSLNLSTNTSDNEPILYEVVI